MPLLFQNFTGFGFSNQPIGVFLEKVASTHESFSGSADFLDVVLVSPVALLWRLRVFAPDPRSVQTVTSVLATRSSSVAYGHHRPPTPKDLQRSVSGV